MNPKKTFTSRTGDDQVLGKAYDIALIRRLWKFMRPHSLLVFIDFLLVPLMIAPELAQPYLLKLAISDHIAVNKPAGLQWLCLLYLGLILFQATISYFEQWVVQLVGQRSMHGMRLAIYDHVMSQCAAFFDRMPVGRLMTRMTNDIESINEMFASGVITLPADFIKMLAIVAIMLSMNVKLTLVTFISVPFLLILVNYARNAMRRSFRAIRVRLAAMNAFAQEHLSGVRVIHLLGRQKIATAEYDEINAGHRDAYLESIRADAAMYALVEAIGRIAVAGVLWLSARELAAHGVSIAADVATAGLVIAFIEYINKFFIPVRDLSAKYAVMQGAMAATERIMQLLDTNEPDAPKFAPDEIPDVAATITSPLPLVEFDNVRFSYGAEPVLQGASLIVPRGSTVAVVGATGSGKSTLIKLLTRLYEVKPGEGAIRVSGTDIRTMPVEDLRKLVTVVSQDGYMFTGTIEDNIRLGSTATTAQIEAALATVGLDRALRRRATDGQPITSLHVADRGNNFSAGERQLVAFARALVRNPEILILDEATAHVDPESESLIEAGVDALMRGRTTLVIAHRLTTIQNSDLIVVMDRGKIIEQGTHTSLIAAGGVYAALERTFRRAGHSDAA